MPISSSAHTILLPFLAGWPYAELDPELRKSFEVALHAGAGIALAIDMRRDLIAQASRLDRRRGAVLALSLAPPAIVGYLLEGPIERRLGGPRSIAAGLFTGAVAMAIADGRGRARSTRKRDDARASDGLALGLAQTLALIPGVSRNGATLTAARARGFGRGDAQALSWHAALRVILGASALKGSRLARRGAPAGDGSHAGWPAAGRPFCRRSPARGCCAEHGSRSGRCCPMRSTAACSRPAWLDACERRTIRTDDHDDARHPARRALPP